MCQGISHREHRYITGTAEGLQAKPPTWAVDEGPVVFGLARAHAGIEGGLGDGR